MKEKTKTCCIKKKDISLGLNEKFLEEKCNK